MNTNKTKNTFKIHSNIAVIKYTLFAFLIFTTGFVLMKFSESTFSGVTKGLEISFKTLIPSLYPFLVFSSFVVDSQITVFMFKPLKKAAHIIFSLPEQVFTVFILSVVGGYPVGPQMIKQLYEKGEISQLQGRKMLLFCMNPSLAFTVSTVGYVFLKSEILGGIIFISVLLSSLMVGLLQKIVKPDDYIFSKKSDKQKDDIVISKVIIDSVKNSISSMLMICAWVILFSGLMKIIDATVLNEPIKNFIYSVCEVTTGCETLSDTLSVPTVAGIVGFGGLCTHLQVFPCICKLKLRYKYFLISRIIIASLSAVICQLLINIIPEAIQTISIGNRPVYSDYGVSFGATVSLMIMSVLLLIGDNYIFKVKKHNH